MKQQKPKKWKVNGKERWVFDAKINGTRRREQFDTKEQCESFIRTLDMDTNSTAWWTDLKPADRVEIMASFKIAQEDGFSLRHQLRIMRRIKQVCPT